MPTIQVSASSVALVPPLPQRLTPRPSSLPAPLAPQVMSKPGAQEGTRLLGVVLAAIAGCPARGTVDPRHCFSHNSQATELIAGSLNVFARMGALIATARREVLWQGYLWVDPCAAATALRDGLQRLVAAQAARALLAGGVEPVVVRIFVRRMPMRRRSQRNTQQLEALIAATSPRLVTFELQDHREFSCNALHSKVLLVDGHQALLTGANPEHHNDNDRWFDSGVWVAGEVVHALRRETAQLAGECRRRCANVAGAIPWPELPAYRAVATAMRPSCAMVVLARRGQHNCFRRSLNNAPSQAMLAAIAAAERCIDILTPSLNVAAVMRAVLAAAGRGVRCRLLLPYKFNRFTNSRAFLQGGSNETTVRRLLHHSAAAGARDNLHIRWFCAAGQRTVGNADRCCHAKGLNVDDVCLYMGSSNMDHQSFFRSREVGIAIFGAEVASIWKAHIFLPLYRRAVPVSGADGANEGQLLRTPHDT